MGQRQHRLTHLGDQLQRVLVVAGSTGAVAAFFLQVDE
jgi:hypothetical protein